MGSLADLIEGYLRSLIQQRGGQVVVRRSELAERLGCVPSQITYVLLTRFTPERGYVVESRRGGGGYIRIRRLGCPTLREAVTYLEQRLDQGISQEEAIGLLLRLQEERLLTEREATMLRRIVDREAIALPLPERDLVRVRLLRASLRALLAEGGHGEPPASP